MQPHPLAKFFLIMTHMNFENSVWAHTQFSIAMNTILELYEQIEMSLCKVS